MIYMKSYKTLIYTKHAILYFMYSFPAILHLIFILNEFINKFNVLFFNMSYCLNDILFNIFLNGDIRFIGLTNMLI